MPIEPRIDATAPMRLISGFAKDVPPFAFGKADPHPEMNRMLAHDAIDLICDFIESGDACWSHDYAKSLDADMARKASRVVEMELKAMAPHGVTVIRRASQLYLMRR